MRKLLFLLVLSITGLLALAQETRVTGKVTTATGEPVAGASVVVKGQSKGAATNAAGNFTITVPKGATLVITSIGFAPQEITANNTNLTATLIYLKNPPPLAVVMYLGLCRMINFDG